MVAGDVKDDIGDAGDSGVRDFVVEGNGGDNDKDDGHGEGQ